MIDRPTILYFWVYFWFDGYHDADREGVVYQIMKIVDNLFFPAGPASQTALSANSAGYQTDKGALPVAPHSSVRCVRPAGAALVLLGLLAATRPICAATLTDLSFTSNSGGFINNTIVDGTSPLGITLPGLGQSFLNNEDSTISLPFGAYYAYSFAGFGQHVGSGTISGRFDGAPFSGAVTFPSDLVAVANFFTFTFVSGDTLKVGTTGLSADRIRIVADGGGLVPDGTTDAIYSFNFTTVPEPTSITLIGIGMIGALARRSRMISA